MNEMPQTLYCFHFIWIPEHGTGDAIDAVKILHTECRFLVDDPPGYDLLTNDRLKGTLPSPDDRCEICNRPTSYLMKSDSPTSPRTPQETHLRQSSNK